MRINLVNSSLINSTSKNRPQSNHSVSTPNFKARLNKDIFQKTISKIKIDSEKYFTYDSKGYLPIYYATAEEMKNIHNSFANTPELIAKMHLMPIKFGKLKMHSASVEEAKEIHRALENQPDVIAQIHLTRDWNHALPMHYADAEKAKEIHRALENQPDVIAQIHLIGCPNIHNLPIHYADAEKAKEIHRALKDHPELIAKMHLTESLDSYDLPMHLADAEKAKEIHRALENQPDVIAQIHLTQNRSGDLPIHHASLEKMQEINRVLENQPDVLARMYLTRNYEFRDPKLPITIGKYNHMDSLSVTYATKEKKQEVFRSIANAALNSDLDTNTSIELLETYNTNGDFSEAIKELEKLANKKF